MRQRIATLTRESPTFAQSDSGGGFPCQGSNTLPHCPVPRSTAYAALRARPLRTDGNICPAAMTSKPAVNILRAPFTSAFAV